MSSLAQDDWFASNRPGIYRMNTNLALVLLLLAAAIVMFMANRPRMDSVALLMIVIIPIYWGDYHQRGAGGVE